MELHWLNQIVVSINIFMYATIFINILFSFMRLINIF